jgi:hypothetical protein
MNFIDNIDPLFFAWAILCSATVFTLIWFLDALTHARLVKVDITEKELFTHRVLILTSMIMELSLVLMFWLDIEILPLFLAAFITRTAHEFIDELHWHTDRCSFYETMLHLVMWLSVLNKTFLLFIWGFFTHYKGLSNLHPAFYTWGIIIVILMALTSWKEWNQEAVKTKI